MAHRARHAGTMASVLGGDTDEALMFRYQRGDVRAFELLLGRHRRPIYNFILRFVRDKAQAEDLLQDTFLRVIRSAASYQKQAKFTTWLYTIARNLCVDASRRAKHRKTQSLDAPMNEDDTHGATRLDMVPGKNLPADRSAIGGEIGSRLEVALERLVPEQREVFLMREFHDLSFGEIAEIVGCPENTVKSRMRYALEKLRGELEEFADLAKALP